MPKVKYEQHALLLKDSLERLFWIEIAKRKQRLSQPLVFTGLLAVRQQLEVFFAKSTPALDEPFESGPGVFFDFIQFNQKIDQIAIQPEYRYQLEEAIKLFGEETRAIYRELVYCRGFRLADFSIETDLVQLHRWWSYLTSSEGRKELNTEGPFSVAGKPRPILATKEIWVAGDENPTIEKGELVDTITSLQSPVRFPIRLPARYVTSYATESHEIRVDGRQLVDRVVLDFDVLKPLPTIRQIEFVIRSAHGAARAGKYFDLLVKGELRPDLSPNAKDNDGLHLLSLMYEPPETYKFAGQVSSIRPLIGGLRCLDFVSNDKMTHDQAAEQTVAALVDHNGKTVFSFEQARYAHQTVLPKVKQYEPEELPWNS